MTLPPVVQHWLPLPSGLVWQDLGNAGGFSGARFWRTTQGTESWCLRRWSLEHPQPERLRQLHGWLERLRSLEFVPVPERGRDGQTWLTTEQGRWELTRWLPGQADYAIAPSEEKLRAAVRVVAQVHRAWADESSWSDEPPSLRQRRLRFQELVGGQADQLRRAALREPDGELRALGGAVLEQFAQQQAAMWRALATQQQRLRVQPCVCDIWHDHVLFTGSRVTGLVDFGAVRVDTPATDLGRLLGSLVADDDVGWGVARKAYEEVSPLTDVEWELARLLDRSGCLLGACNWLTWVWLEQRVFDDPQRVKGRLSQLVARMAGWSVTFEG